MSQRVKLAFTTTVLVATAILVSFSINVKATSPTRLSMPDFSGTCLNNHATFTTALTASNLTNVNTWQANITFASSKIIPMSIAWGPSFTNGLTAGSNATGYYELAFSFLNGASITTSSQTTLVTFTWKTIVNHASSIFHIVTPTENPGEGSELLTPALQAQSYSTTDGFIGCQS